jgi:hypothetical protein
LRITAATWRVRVKYGCEIEEGTHRSHPAWLAALSTQVSAQGGRVVCAWENEMYREARMIGRVRVNLSMLDLEYRRYGGGAFLYL